MMTATMDSLPWNDLLQVVTLVSAGLIMWQIKTASFLDHRRHPKSGWWLFVRRTSMWMKLLSLCWAVVYGHYHDWQPWPPFMVFLIFFDIYLVTHIMIMKEDIERLSRLDHVKGARPAS